jgi:hypothetical protein
MSFEIYRKYSNVLSQEENFSEPNVITHSKFLALFFAIIKKVMAFVHVFVVTYDNTFMGLLSYVILCAKLFIQSDQAEGFSQGAVERI